MKHMISSFKMKGDDHFLMLWFHKDSLVTVGFRTLRRGGGSPGVLNKIVDFGGPKSDIWSPECKQRNASFGLIVSP